LEERIAADHRRIESLAAAVIGAEGEVDDTARAALVRELSVHAAAEEQVVYPALRRTEAGDGLADAALHDHRAMKDVLVVVDRTVDTAEGRDALRRLVDLLAAHVPEEEHLLVLLRRQLGDGAMAELAEQFQLAKLAAPTRPHPHAPDTPPGNLVAGPVAAAADQVRDAAAGVAAPAVPLSPPAVDRLAGLVGALRVAVGTSLLVAPGLAGRIWMGPGAGTPAARTLARVVGARDVALGLAMRRAAREDRPSAPLVRLGVAADVADAVATVLAWRTLTPWRRLVMPAVAATVAGAGVSLVRRITAEPAPVTHDAVPVTGR
jgi:hypothetical protein